MAARSRTEKNMPKWGLAKIKKNANANDECECGEVQDERHIFECPNLNVECGLKDVQDTNDTWPYVRQNTGTENYSRYEDKPQ